MPRKKLILFIVEGINDKTCLESVLEKIIDGNDVRFKITDGDITTRKNMDEYKIKNEIGLIVKAFKDLYHLKPEQFLEVVHIIDTDGAYLKPESVFYDEVDKVIYKDKGIYTENVDAIIKRNKQKSDIIDRMIDLNKVLKSVPYSVYYFSSNMDHVLHNNANLSKEEKDLLADEFEEKYGDNPKEFLELINNSEFTVLGEYDESWKFIKTGNRSVQRLSNFAIYLNKYNYES